jgi:succinylglutamate desuccinylase
LKRVIEHEGFEVGNSASSSVSSAGRYRRVLGRRSGAERGPLLVVMTGIHGNEPAGLIAAERVLQSLEARGLPRRGDVVFLAGNLEALERRVRFVDRDLNREWTRERLAAVLGHAARPDEPTEHGEMRELLGPLDGALSRSTARCSSC